MSASIFGRPAPQSVNSFIFGSRRWQVIAAGLVARQISGGEVYVYRHGLLPASTSPDHIEHLLRLGMIRKLEEEVTS